MLGAQDFRAGRDLYRATPAVTLGLGFPVSSEGLPHSVASYDTQGDVEDLFKPGSSRINTTIEFCKMLTIIQNSEVNVSNVIIIQKANTKRSVRQHEPPTNAKVGSCAMEK
jgi:hypothetical protein